LRLLKQGGVYKKGWEEGMKTAESNVDFASIGGIDPRAFPLTALEKAQNVCGG